MHARRELHNLQFGQGRGRGSCLDGAEAERLLVGSASPRLRPAGDPLQRVVIGSRALLASDGGPTTALARPSRFVSSGRLGHPIIEIGRGDRAVERGFGHQDSNSLSQMARGHFCEPWASGRDVARGLVVPPGEHGMPKGHFNPSRHQSASPFSGGGTCAESGQAVAFQQPQVLHRRADDQAA